MSLGSLFLMSIYFNCVYSSHMDPNRWLYFDPAKPISGCRCGSWPVKPCDFNHHESPSFEFTSFTQVRGAQHGPTPRPRWPPQTWPHWLPLWRPSALRPLGGCRDPEPPGQGVSPWQMVGFRRKMVGDGWSNIMKKGGWTNWNDSLRFHQFYGIVC